MQDQINAIKQQIEILQKRTAKHNTGFHLNQAIANLQKASNMIPVYVINVFKKVKHLEAIQLTAETDEQALEQLYRFLTPDEDGYKGFFELILNKQVNGQQETLDNIKTNNYRYKV